VRQYGDVNEIARRAHAAIVAKDWTGSDGRTMRGRSKVIAALAHAAEAPAPPASVELRDGQIYRRRSCPPSGTRLPNLPQAADAAEHDAPSRLNHMITGTFRQ